MSDSCVSDVHLVHVRRPGKQNYCPPLFQIAEKLSRYGIAAVFLVSPIIYLMMTRLFYFFCGYILFDCQRGGPNIRKGNASNSTRRQNNLSICDRARFAKPCYAAMSSATPAPSGGTSRTSPCVAQLCGAPRTGSAGQ